MKKKIIYGLLFAVAMVTATSSFVSCKDYEGDDYARLEERTASLEAALAWQLSQIKQCNCTEFSKTLTKEMLDGWYQPKGNYQVAGDYVTNEDLTRALADYLLSTDAFTVADLETYLTTNHYLTGKDTINLSNQIQAINTLIANYYHYYQNDSTRNDSLWNIVLGWGPDLKKALQEVTKINTTVANDSDKWNKAVEIAEKAWKFVNEGKVKYKEKEYTNLQDLTDAFADAEKKLQKDIENLLGAFKKQITGININGTYNPVFGTLSMPANITSNVLAAFYGEVDKDITFPSCDGGYYVNNEALYDEADFDLINECGGLPKDITKKGLTISKADDNAGKLYVTINPANVDFEGTDFFLRQSGNSNEEVPVTLSPLKPSEKVLTFGYTRGTTIESGADKGFYELNAKIEPEDVKDMKININLRDFKEPVKNLINDVKATASQIKNNQSVSGGRAIVSDLAQLAAKIYANSSDIAPRLAMQAEWVDTTGTRVVSSDYNIAAVAVSPLGFSTLPTFNFGEKQFIKYIDGRKIDQEIYDIITENLKLELNLNLGLEFKEMVVGQDLQNNVVFKLPVYGYELTSSSYWFKADETANSYDVWVPGNEKTGGYWDTRKGYRMELIACDDSGNILYNPDGSPRTTGIYTIVGEVGSDDIRIDWDKWTIVGNEPNGRIYRYYNTGSTDYLWLDVTEFANTLLYGEHDKATDTYGKVDANGDGVIATGVFGTLNDQLAKFNSQVANINGIDAKIKEQVEEAINKMGVNIAVSLSDYVNNYVAKVNNLITRLNNAGNKALSYLSDPNRFLQPILLSYDSSHRLSTISRSFVAPTKVGAGDVIALQPTTLTLETVAPAYKKHIAVSNVWTGGTSAKAGDATCKALMTAANTGLSTEVLEGVHALGMMQIPANAAKGTVFELTYTALDYYGKIAGKKFYLVVK